MDMVNRRRFLRAGLAAGSLLALPRYAWPQAPLLSLPKIALVLGNSRYKLAPLKNPANDAAAIGEALKALAFAVTMKLDANKAEMAAAVQAYVAELVERKCVGLFYYAGHGIQLAWRNYMLPVDVDIDTIADIQKQGVEVNSLLEGITTASNPMNVIILDACRDNPFGNLTGVDHKGLSQMDAPPGTLLAYATSPGHAASDGAGAHGLYTEHLLKELRVPEAKVEDVFKRVRLGVRRQSNGAQIPWESTSLEEDFWFIPPAHLATLSEAQKEKQFDEELAFWEKRKTSEEAAPLEDYLRRYPSGRFAELAQLRLDQILARRGERRIEAVSGAGNPYTQGSARADTAFKVGDTYTYRELDLDTRAERRTYTDVVSEIRELEVMFRSGLILDRLANVIRLPDGRTFTSRQDQPLEYAVGRRWTTRFGGIGQAGRSDIEFEFRIVRREKITVPAGTFDCFVIEGDGAATNERGAKIELRHKRWMAPHTVRRPIVIESYRKVRPGRGRGGRGGMERVLNSERTELLSYKQS